ncbi:hypothetical protein [Nocardioides sp.]|uniref:hypothetical protein n=1 Tax=Nocardioides sp. TaxID=35761 RepID=UPI002BD0AC24|nr:hypothetical protein [Nocardioides sp.]HSX69235.1 hypothetical protein [Nocardioides sp.]
MGDSGSRVRAFAGRSATFVKGRPRSQQLVGGGLALALLTAPFGGFESVSASTLLGSIEIGVPMQVGPFEVTLEKVVTVPDLAPTVTPEPGRKLLVVVASVENTGNRPWGVRVLTDALPAPADGGIEANDLGKTNADVYDYDDTSQIRDINPGIRHKAVLVWQQDEDWSGDSVTLTVDELEWVGEDTVLRLSDERWRDLDRPVAQGVFPVEVRP